MMGLGNTEKNLILSKNPSVLGIVMPIIVKGEVILYFK